MVTIAFTGGGTGGHIYPGLAVIERLKKRIDCRVVWIGSDSGMDRSIVERAGIEFIGIPSGRLRRYLTPRNLADSFRVLAGFFAARRALKKLAPAVLFSKGGFVSVPPCYAAATLGIPVFTHESDYSPGLATRLNSRVAERVLTAYPQTVAALPPAARASAVAVGNPVRAAFASADPARGRRFLGIGEGERVLVVLGGSQGALQVNELVASCLALLCARYVVVHQTGSEWEARSAELSRTAPSGRYLPYAYIRDELPDVVAAAEVVVGRSGAGTVWEASALGKPMILIPLSGAGTRGDQVENARYFAEAGAAVSLVGASATAEALAEAVRVVSGDEALRTRMAAASRAAGRADAADAAADLVVERIGGGK